MAKRASPSSAEALSEIERALSQAVQLLAVSSKRLVSTVGEFETPVPSLAERLSANVSLEKRALHLLSEAQGMVRGLEAPSIEAGAPDEQLQTAAEALKAAEETAARARKAKDMFRHRVRSLEEENAALRALARNEGQEGLRRRLEEQRELNGALKRALREMAERQGGPRTPPGAPTANGTDDAAAEGDSEAGAGEGPETAEDGGGEEECGGAAAEKAPPLGPGPAAKRELRRQPTVLENVYSATAWWWGVPIASDEDEDEGEEEGGEGDGGAGSGEPCAPDTDPPPPPLLPPPQPRRGSRPARPALTSPRHAAFIL